MRRTWARLFLSPSALSNTAIAWSALIGGISTLLLVPGASVSEALTLTWLAVVLVSQAALVASLVVARKLRPDPSPSAVLGILAAAGAVRGLLISVGGDITGVQAMSASTLIGRIVNSSVITVVGLALLGGTIAWLAEFRRQYESLTERALLLEQTISEGTHVDRSVLMAWTTLKLALDESLRGAMRTLSGSTTVLSLDSAAQTLALAVDVDLRPASRRMWERSCAQPRPASLRMLLLDVLNTWRLPLIPILAFLAVTVGFGSLVRSGLVYGGAFTLRYLAVTGIILGVSTALARHLPQLARRIGISTVVILIPLLLLCDRFLGSGLLGLPPDSLGQLIVAIQTPITTLLISVTVAAIDDRQRVLGTLRDRVQNDARVLLAHETTSHVDARNLSVYVHHSVQSELSALSLQLREAASTGDGATMTETRDNVLAHLDRILAVDAQTPPWFRQSQGRQRITDVVDAWSGILQITLSIPQESQCRSDQWLIASEVIEEGLTNAARHADASSVVIAGHMDGSAMVLTLSNDGAVAFDGSRGVSVPSGGMGTKYLDRIAPGDWRLNASPQGATLTVRIH